MDVEDIVRLRKNWPHLVKYLKPKNPKLLDKLYQHAVLNELEFTQLQTEENPKTRAVKLSGILKHKGQATFERFLTCLRKHYDSLAKKIEKTSVTETEIREQVELEKYSSSDYDSLNHTGTGTDVPASPSLHMSGVSCNQNYGRRQDVLGWLTDMSLSDPIEADSINMSLSEEGGLSGRSSDHANTPFPPGGKSVGKKITSENSGSALEQWSFRSMRMSRGAELGAGLKLRQSTRTAPVGENSSCGEESSANQSQTQALVHNLRGAPTPRQTRSRTPEPRNVKPRSTRDHSVGSLRRIKTHSQMAELRTSPSQPYLTVDNRTSPSSNNNHVARPFGYGNAKSPLFMFGREGKEPGEFRYPRNILIDDEQKIYVVDRGNSRIQVFTTAGSYLYQFGIGSKFIGNGSDVWCTTTDVALSRSGNNLICPKVVCAKSAKPWPLSGLSEAAEIQVYTKTGGLISSFKYQELQFGLCVTVNSRGHIIVPDYETPFIYNFNSDGCLISRYGGPGKDPGRFDCPTSVCSGIDDDIIVTDSTNQRVHILDKFGELRTCFGSRGDDVSQFQWPAGVCVDASGCILVSDSVTNRIQMFSYDGTFIRTVADTEAGLDHPCGLAVSPEGLLYVADQKNHCIKVFRYV